MLGAKAGVAGAAFAAGVVAAFATLSALGWRDRGNDRATRPPPAETTQRVYVLRDGDVVVRREAAVRCEASAEGGFRNLYCARLSFVRPHVIFYDDCVHVWPVVPRTSDEGFPVTFGPRPKGGCGRPRP